MPKVSIIVPVYNTGKYLDKCLHSLINQTMQDIEIIIVNDGSTDNSEKIINEYIKKYPDKIKYFAQSNRGTAYARNYGVTKATGNYLSFIDSDDYVDLNLYKNLEQEIEQNVDLIKFKMSIVDEDSKEIQKINGPIFVKTTGEDAFNQLVSKDTMIDSCCIYLYKRETFLQNKFIFPENRYIEDFGLVPIVIIESKTVSSTNIYGYYYVQRNTSTTKDTDYKKIIKTSYDLLYHYDNIFKQIEINKLNEKTRNNLLSYFTNAILLATKKLNHKDSKNYIQEIKKRNLINNIKPKNIKQSLKKMMLKTNIKLYLLFK